MGKHLEQALPSVCTLQCLTGKVDNNNNNVCACVRVMCMCGNINASIIFWFSFCSSSDPHSDYQRAWDLTKAHYEICNILCKTVLRFMCVERFINV